MTHATLVSTPLPAPERVDAVGGPHRRNGVIAMGLLATVVVVDQATKWWGWRHAPQTFINGGSTWLIGRPVSAWFSGPVSGPILDLLNTALLTLAGLVLVRHARRTAALVSGALMIGGWSSNLFDRLGMHSLSAPGSIRGAVDFIPLGAHLWNVADFVIVGSTVLLLVAAGSRRVRRATASRHLPPVPRPRLWGLPQVCLAVVGVALTVAAAIHAGS